jgi:hypothetical protein
MADGSFATSKDTGVPPTGGLPMTDPRPTEPGIQLTPEQMKRRRARSIAIGVALLALVVLFYVVTIAKLGPGVLNRPL